LQPHPHSEILAAVGSVDVALEEVLRMSSRPSGLHQNFRSCPGAEAPGYWQTPLWGSLAARSPKLAAHFLLFFSLMSPILTSVLLGLTAAGANVFGGAIIVQKHWERSYLRYFVALGAGFMLATSLVEMVPASIELRGPRAGFLILLGYLLVHFFEHTVTPHFHFGEETHADQFVRAHKGYSVLLGLLIHTFFDGIAIASGFIVSTWLGWVIFLAVFLHKIPEGFTVTSVMLASGRSRGFAWGASVMLGAATVAGVMTMAVFRHEVGFGLPLSAGVTIYVAASDLIPEVNQEPGVRMAVLVFVGVACLFALDRFFHVH
jgi:zinc and cadmium transporter